MPWPLAHGGYPTLLTYTQLTALNGRPSKGLSLDGFYEFTAPADPKAKRKDKWLFTLKGEPWFWIAGIVKQGAFTMLTTSPGPDMAPLHGRQMVLGPLPGGSLEVSAVPMP